MCKHLEITEAACYRWRGRFGGMKADDAKRFEERERAAEKKMVSEQALDIDMLKD